MNNIFEINLLFQIQYLIKIYQCLELLYDNNPYYKTKTNYRRHTFVIDSLKMFDNKRFSIKGN